MAAVDRRQLILDAAAESFARFGYKATTMDQVARIANVGKGTIYTFFANKEELFEEILLSVMLEMKRIAERTIRKDRHFFDNLYDALDALLDFRDEHSLFVKLGQEKRDLGTAKAGYGLSKVENGIVSYIQGVVENAIEQQEIKPCDAQVIAFVMLKLYTSLAGDFNGLREPLAKDAVKQYMMLFMEQGLKDAGSGRM
ncbi:TetR/AcrR family transcriptional regulator [Paenibacillus sp. JSM ZJ436]|uniref:TetR/AcrR family transcriptional regulator n=1 Tax=Paenibacillus sp. JSM ZJ436 TaxID=3376190 RepID=UPI0037A74EC2